VESALRPQRERADPLEERCALDDLTVAVAGLRFANGDALTMERTERTLVRHEFGPEGTTYLRSYLESNERFGKQLGRLLLTHHDLDRGTVWAFVPADSPLDRRTAFEEGGLSPARVPSWDERAVGWLLDQLRQPSATGRVLLVEGAVERRTDPWLQKWPDDPVVFCGDDVYFYETAQAPAADVERWLGGATWKPDVGIVTHLPHRPDRLTKRQDLTLEELSEMAGGASVIVVGAWDHEAFMFWEAPARSTTEASSF
jgi:hypothetical protein